MSESDSQAGEPLPDDAAAAASDKPRGGRLFRLGEAILDAAERYLELAGDDDLNGMSFADTCKALAVACRLGEEAESKEKEDPSTSANALRDQVTAMLDQIYANGPSPKCAAFQANSTTPAQTQP